MLKTRRAKLRFPLAVLLSSYQICGAAKGFGGEGTIPLESRSYDCGANSLFILSNMLLDRAPLSYARCLELLPICPDGNSLKEVQAAVRSIDLSGETVEVQPRELSGLRVPAIVLWFPAVAKDTAIGHFFAVRPLSRNRFQVMDFMEGHPVVMDSSQLVVNLAVMRVTKIFLVLAGSKESSLNEMLMPIATSMTTQPVEAKEDIGIEKIDGGLSSPIHWDFGEAYEAAHLQHDFIFENRTGKTLHVEEVKASCGCTSITTDQDAVSDNGRLRLSTVISLEGRHLQFRSDGVLLFKEAAIPAIQMEMVGKVLPRWISTPTSLDIGDVSPDQNGIERDVLVRPSVKSLDNPRIVSVSSSSDEMSVSLDSGSTEQFDGRVIHVSVNPRAIAGVIDSTISMRIDGQKLPVEICHVSANVVADTIVSPAMGLMVLKDHKWDLLQPILIRGLGVHTVRSVDVSEGVPPAVISYVGSKSVSSGDFLIESKGRSESPHPQRGKILVKVVMEDGKTECREIAIVPVPSN